MSEAEPVRCRLFLPTRKWGSEEMGGSVHLLTNRTGRGHSARPCQDVQTDPMCPLQAGRLRRLHAMRPHIASSTAPDGSGIAPVAFHETSSIKKTASNSAPVAKPTPPRKKTESMVTVAVSIEPLGPVPA